MPGDGHRYLAWGLTKPPVPLQATGPTLAERKGVGHEMTLSYIYIPFERKLSTVDVSQCCEAEVMVYSVWPTSPLLRAVCLTAEMGVPG